MKLRYRPFLILFSLLFTTTVVLSLIYYFKAKRALLAQTHEHLEWMAENKITRLNNLIASRYELSKLLANNYSINEAGKSNKILSALLKTYIKQVPSFRSIHILNLKGKVIVSSDNWNIGKDFSHHDAFLLPVKGKSYFEGVHYGDKYELEMYLAGPIYHGKKLTGIMVIDTDASDIKYLIGDYAGMGLTGETELAKKVGDKIVYIAPLRHDPDAALKRNISIYETEAPLAKALSGVYGLTEAVDYRGEPVFSSMRVLEETGWGVVIKMDIEEATSQIKQLKKAVWKTVLLTIFLSAIVSYFVAIYLKIISKGKEV